MRAVCLLALALVSFACATTRTAGTYTVEETSSQEPEAQRPNPFPTADRLEELGAAAPPVLSVHEEAAADAWTLAGPFPQSAVPQPHAEQSPWHQLLATWAQGAGKGALPSEDMHCAARELGRFYLAKGAFPQRSLVDFIGARCMSSAVQIRMARVSGDVPAQVSDEKVLEAWRATIDKTLAAFGHGGEQELVGMWFGRENGKAVLAFASGAREVRLEEAGNRPDAQGRLVVRGSVLRTGAQTIHADVTQGRYGVGRCERDESVSLPRFAFHCPTNKADPSALVEVSVVEQGRFIGQPVLALLGFPAGAPQDTWHSASEVGTAKAGGVEEMREQFVGLLNGVRARAGLAPVQLAQRESRVAQKVAPHFLAAWTGSAYQGNAGQVIDLVAMGLMAGWDVDGRVQQGQFGSLLLHPSDDLGQLVSDFIARPSFRAMVLDPKARQLAVGPVRLAQEQLVGALVGTYRLVEPTSQEALQKAFLERLAAARKSAGKSAPQQLGNLMPLAAEAAARLDTGRTTPLGARDELMHKTVERVHGRVHGWYMDFSSFEELDIPQELLSPEALPLAVGIASYRHPGEPWTRYVALIVSVESANETASAPAEGHGG